MRCKIGGRQRGSSSCSCSCCCCCCCRAAKDTSANCLTRKGGTAILTTHEALLQKQLLLLGVQVLVKLVVVGKVVQRV